MAVLHDPLKAEHILRNHATFTRPNGVKYVGGAFCPIVKKVKTPVEYHSLLLKVVIHRASS